jgi:hypothetical protein
MEDRNNPEGIKHHLEEEQAEKYSMGCFTAMELAPIEEHLLICAACRAKVASHDDFAVAMKTAASQLMREPKRPRARLFFFPRLIPIAAAAGLILVLAGVGTRVVSHNRVPAFAVSLQAVRGVLVGNQAPAGRPLILQLDLAELPQAAYRVEVVDASGVVVWKGIGLPSPANSTAVAIHGLNAGVYFVRVYASSGGLLREYGLEVSR